MIVFVLKEEDGNSTSQRTKKSSLEKTVKKEKKVFNWHSNEDKLIGGISKLKKVN